MRVDVAESVGGGEYAALKPSVTLGDAVISKLVGDGDHDLETADLVTVVLMDGAFDIVGVPDGRVDGVAAAVANTDAVEMGEEEPDSDTVRDKSVVG